MTKGKSSETPSTSVSNVYSLQEVKECLDSNLKYALTTPGMIKAHYKQSFFYEDLKIAVGIVLVLITGASFYIDKKLKFNETINLQVILIATYFATSFGYWVVIKKFEKDSIFLGSSISTSQKNKENKAGSATNKKTQISIRTNIETDTVFHPDLAPKYSLDIEVTDVSGKTSFSTIKGGIEITKLFSENGNLQTLEFYDFIDSIISKKLE